MRSRGLESQSEDENLDYAHQKAHPLGKTPGPVCFNRNEIYQILQIYGMRVAKGEWRDYAINTYKDRAVFSIFRKTSEMPLYRIEKNMRFAKKQGAFRIITPTGLILKRGHNLRHVLRAISPKTKLSLV